MATVQDIAQMSDEHLLALLEKQHREASHADKEGIAQDIRLWNAACTPPHPLEAGMTEEANTSKSELKVAIAHRAAARIARIQPGLIFGGHKGAAGRLRRFRLSEALDGALRL